MPLTLDEISEKLDAVKIKHSTRDGRIRLSFRTDVYEDTDGDDCLSITIWTEHQGETLRLHCLGAYRLPTDEFPAKLAAVQRTLNQLNWETKLAQYEMDTEDGEIRMGIDVAIEDGTVTEKQLRRLVQMLPNMADRDYAAIRAALDHGTVYVTHEELCRRFDAAMIARDKR